MPLNLPPPPPPPSSSKKKKPLGVPEDYTTSQFGMQPTRVFGANVAAPATVQAPPRYFEGDELTPANLSPEVIVELQRGLRASGLIGPKAKFRLGLWDETTRNAYRNLLEFANATGVDEREALRTYANSAAFDPESLGEGRAPLVAKVSNPDDLRELFDVAARAKIGRRLPPEQLERMIRAYQAAEMAEQEGAYTAGETGGVVTGTVDPRLFAASQAEQFDPEGADEMEGISLSNDFFSLLDGSGG